MTSSDHCDQALGSTECANSTTEMPTLAERLRKSSRFIEFVKKLAAAQAKAETASLMREVRTQTEFIDQARLRRKARRRRGVASSSSGHLNPRRPGPG
jgi:hypothetical protein